MLSLSLTNIRCQEVMFVFLFRILKDVKIIHLQNICDDSHTPHIRAIGDAIKVNNFRSHKFRCTKKDLSKRAKKKINKTQNGYCCSAKKWGGGLQGGGDDDC